MRWTFLPLLALLLALGVASPAHADVLTDDLTALNARWDAAINGPDFDALLPMYSSDAELMPPGAKPVTGPAAIRDFFAARGKSVRDHHLQLVRVVTFGNYSYVTSHFTALFVKDGSEPVGIPEAPFDCLSARTMGLGKSSLTCFFGSRGLPLDVL